MPVSIHGRIQAATDAIAHELSQHSTRMANLGRRADIDATGRDGYPSRASGAAPGSSTARAVHHDVETFPCHRSGRAWGWRCVCGAVDDAGRYDSSYAAQRAGEAHMDAQDDGGLDYSDPTGEAAVAGELVRDPVKHAGRAAARLLEQAHELIRQAGQLAVSHDRQGLTVADPEGWCTHHQAVMNAQEPALYRGLCRWCGEFAKANNGRLPARQLLEARAQGRKITSAMVTAALATPHGKKRAS